MGAPMLFWERFTPGPGCWEWQGRRDRDGYGISKGRGQTSAHRLSWVLHRGSIPGGMTVDHLCRNRACVNPDHMELVTARENTLRSDAPTAQHARQTQCVNGHEFSEANTRIVVNSRGTARYCRACVRGNSSRYRARKAELL